MSEDRSTRQVLRSLVLPVYVPTLLQAIGSTAILPVIPLMALRLGYTEAAAAAITMITGVVGVLGPVPIGRTMQQVGERLAMIVTGFSLALTNVGGWALLESARQCPTHAHRLALLGIITMMALTQQVWQLGRQSYLGEQLPAHLRASGMSTFGGMMRIGQIIGPAVGAVVLGLGHIGWVYLLDVVTITSATLLVMVAMVPGERRGLRDVRGPRVVERIDPREPSPYAPGRPAIQTMLMAALGSTPLVIGRMARSTILPLAGAAWGMSESSISLVFAVAAAAEILLFAPAGLVMDRFGRVAVATPCLVVMGVGYLGLGLATPWLCHAGPLVAGLGLGAAAVLMAIGNGLGSGILMTLGVDLSPERARTRHLARWQMIQGVGRLAAPSLVSAVSLVAPVAAAGLVTGVLCLAGGAWFFYFLPTATPRSKRAEAAALA